MFMGEAGSPAATAALPAPHPQWSVGSPSGQHPKADPCGWLDEGQLFSSRSSAQFIVDDPKSREDSGSRTGLSDGRSEAGRVQRNGFWSSVSQEPQTGDLRS